MKVVGLRFNDEAKGASSFRMRVDPKTQIPVEIELTADGPLQYEAGDTITVEADIEGAGTLKGEWLVRASQQISQLPDGENAAPEQSTVYRLKAVGLQQVTTEQETYERFVGQLQTAEWCEEAGDIEKANRLRENVPQHIKDAFKGDGSEDS